MWYWVLIAAFFTLPIPAWALDCPFFFEKLLPAKLAEQQQLGHYDKVVRKMRDGSLLPAYGEFQLKRLFAEDLTKMGIIEHPYLFEGKLPILSQRYKAFRKWDNHYAITHPGLPDLLRRLEEIGVMTVVSPAPLLEGANANFSVAKNGMKFIFLHPRAPWHTLIHEAEHAFGNHLGIMDGVVNKLNPTAVEKKMIDEAKALWARGFDNLATDETMAYQKQIREMYKMGYIPWETQVYQKRVKMWNYQRNSLRARLASLSPEEKRELNWIDTKEFFLNPWVIRSVMGIGLGMGGGIYFQEELGRVFFEGNEEEPPRFYDLPRPQPTVSAPLPRPSKAAPTNQKKLKKKPAESQS